MRAAYNEERKMWNTGGPVMAGRQLTLMCRMKGDKGTGTFASSSEAEKLPVIFFMHGGGFVEGNNDTHSMAQEACSLFRMCCDWY